MYRVILSLSSYNNDLILLSIPTLLIPEVLRNAQIEYDQEEQKQQRKKSKMKSRSNKDNLYTLTYSVTLTLNHNQ